MEIQRNAPNLSGAKPCPSCQQSIARDATLCIHCGCDLATGQRPKPLRRPAAKILAVVLGLAVAIGLAMAASVFLRRAGKAPDSQPAEPRTASRVPLMAPQAAGDAERKAFDAQKAEAEAAFRRKLDEREPMAQVNDVVELRRKNGLVDKGMFMGIAGKGPSRVAIVATATGEIGVPLVTLDNPSRRRVDALFREVFTKHMLSIDADVPEEHLPAE
jgi:hypothetical protein